MTMPLSSTTSPRWCIIVASTLSGGIGLRNELPWSIPNDLKYYQKVTQYVDASRYPQDSTQRQNVVIMGRGTWESIPASYRPMRNRINIVVSSTMTLPTEAADGTYVARSLSLAIEMVKSGQIANVADVYFIGGASILSEVYTKHLNMICRIYHTRIGLDIKCDVFMPPLPYKEFWPYSVSPTLSTNGIPYDFVVYINGEKANLQAEEFDAHKTCVADVPLYPFQAIFEQKVVSDIECCPSVKHRNHGEFAYLDLIKEVLDNGVITDNRTGISAKTLFGKQMKFNLRHTFPLFTTKRVFWRGVAEELFWFIKGDTNSNHLTDNGIKIWEKNGSREFLDSLGLFDREVGDLGPVYGFQWRHFGADYVDMHHNYSGQGVDQLKNCITLIKSNPDDRRILMSAWNPTALPRMALPPCHMFCQFFVSNGELSCCMYQRSCDLGLGVPFNVASYSLLTIMIAQICGLRAGDFIHFLGNAHVYTNHIEPLKEQLLRLPRPFPVLKINRHVPEIEDFRLSDFELTGYTPYPKISMDMAV